jgi:prepilin peptidase CpaA
VLAIAVWYDVRSYRIPNWLIWGGAAAAICTHLVAPGAGTRLESGALGLWIGLMALLPAYALGAAGAGDVKLLALVGIFLGPLHVMQVALMAHLIGGLMAADRLLCARLVPALTGARRLAAARLPYSLAIAGGTAVWLAVHADQ